ncbi:MAG: tetratricopeptide repeat protein, partial [Cyanobacteriota bacterium]
MLYRSHTLKVFTATLLLYMWGQTSNLSLHSEEIYLGISKALAQAPTPQEREVQAKQLLQEGVGQLNRGQIQAALEKFQQALTIYEAIGERANIAVSLNNIGEAYRQLGQYSQALESYQQALTIRQDLGDRKGEGRTLNSIGLLYQSQGQYFQALDFYQQALKVIRELNNRIDEGTILNNIGGIYRQLGEHTKALEFYQQSLAIRKELDDKAGEGVTLTNIGVAYFRLGNYSKALEFYRQALTIFLERLEQPRVATVLNNIGEVYNDLGQFSKALEFYQQAQAIYRSSGSKAGEGATLNNIGRVYYNLDQYSKALEFYQQALEIRREIGDFEGIGTTLNTIGLASYQLGKYSQALEFFQEALAIRRKTGNRTGEGVVLNNLALVHYKLEQYPQALEFYRQASVIYEEVGYKEGARITLGNIGALLEQQSKPELTIAFYKQSVNVAEGIRQELEVLPQEQQESYTETVADIYRRLAELLLSQGRVLEAQQVLELLKIEELRDFTQDTRAGGQTDGITLTSTEEEILKNYNSLTAFGREVEKCKQTRCEKLRELNEQLQLLSQQFDQTTQSLTAEIRSRLAQDRAIFDPEDLPRKAREIIEAQPNTILIYPFVLKDKTWLWWASQGGVVNSYEISGIGQQQLGETVVKFRQLLQNPKSNISEVQATGKQLYDWLIKPLEAELKTNEIKNLVFSLDRVTRYIPMSALFDGEKYLVENYTISTVLSADLTDVRDRLPPGSQTSVLALGLSEAIAGFNPLPNVPVELDAIIKKDSTDNQGIYQGEKFLNRAFNFPALQDNLLNHQILHI